MKLQNIKFFTFIMTCLVVVYHCPVIYSNPVSELDSIGLNIFVDLKELGAVFALSYFFFLSGYLLFRTYEPKLYKEKIARRIHTLLVVYLIWETIFGFNLLISGNFADFLKTVIFLKQWPPNMPLWYIYIIFLSALISPLFYKIMRNKYVGIVSILIVSFFIYFLINIPNEYLYTKIHNSMLSNTLSYLPCYMLGLYFGLHNTRAKNIFVPVILVFLMLILSNILFNEISFNSISACILKVLPILLIRFIPEIKLNKKLNIIFNLSLLIYILHFCIELCITPNLHAFVQSFIVRCTIQNIFNCFIELIIVFVICFIVWLIIGILEPDLFRIITGGRVKPYSKLKLDD